MVELADGTYLGAGNRDVQVLGKEILIRSASDNPLACVVDVEGAPTDPHRGFVLQAGALPGVGLRGITVTGGWVGDRGGAVSCPNPGGPHFSYFENVRFVANTAYAAGTCGPESSR